MSNVFKRVKEEFPIQGQQQQHISVGVEKINPSTLVIFEGVAVLVEMNLNNMALENYDNIYKLWLTLLRYYPTVYQQTLYSFELT